MKFQNPILNFEWREGHTDRQAQAICPFNFFKVGGIKRKSKPCLTTLLHEKTCLVNSKLLGVQCEIVPPMIERSINNTLYLRCLVFRQSRETSRHD